jgi:hypothetical protein
VPDPARRARHDDLHAGRRALHARLGGSNDVMERLEVMRVLATGTG